MSHSPDAKQTSAATLSVVGHAEQAARTLAILSRAGWTSMLFVTLGWAGYITLNSNHEEHPALVWLPPQVVDLVALWGLAVVTIIAAVVGGRWYLVSSLWAVTVWTYVAVQFMTVTTTPLVSLLAAGYAVGAAVRFVECWRDLAAHKHYRKSHG